MNSSRKKYTLASDKYSSMDLKSSTKIFTLSISSYYKGSSSIEFTQKELQHFFMKIQSFLMDFENIKISNCGMSKNSNKIFTVCRDKKGCVRVSIYDKNKNWSYNFVSLDKQGFEDLVNKVGIFLNNLNKILI